MAPSPAAAPAPASAAAPATSEVKRIALGLVKIGLVVGLAAVKNPAHQAEAQGIASILQAELPFIQSLL